MRRGANGYPAAFRYLRYTLPAPHARNPPEIKTTMQPTPIPTERLDALLGDIVRNAPNNRVRSVKTYPDKDSEGGPLVKVKLFLAPDFTFDNKADAEGLRHLIWDLDRSLFLSTDLHAIYSLVAAKA